MRRGREREEGEEEEAGENSRLEHNEYGSALSAFLTVTVVA